MSVEQNKTDPGQTLHLESEQPVPVVLKDGRVGTVSAEDAQGVFNEGGRLANPEDVSHDYDQANAALLRDYFGNRSRGAALLGAARTASFGLSDVGLSAIGEGLATQQIKEQNPGASLAGEIGGAFVPGAGLVGGAIGKAATEGLALGEGASRGAQIASRYAGKAVGGALEGAFYSGSNAVSEAALGNPDEVADNLLTSLGHGALWGGGLGVGFGALGEAAPGIKKIADKASNRADEIASNLAERGGIRLGQASLIARGEGELAEQLPSLIQGKEGRAFQEALKSGEVDKAQSLMDEAMKSQGQLTEESKNLYQAFKDHISDYPKDTRAAALETLEQSGGELGTALDTFYQGLREQSGKMDQYLAEGRLAHMEPVAKESMQSAVDKAITELKNTGESPDRALANELQQIRSARIDGIQNAGDEVVAAKELRERLSDLAGKGVNGSRFGDLSATGRQAIGGFADGKGSGLKDALNNFLERDHPDQFVRDTATKLRQNYEGLSATRDLMSKSGKGLAEYMFNPEAYPKVQKFMANASKYLPEIQKFQEAGSSALKKADAVDNAYHKYLQIAEDAKWKGTRLSKDDLYQALKDMPGAVGVKQEAAYARLKQLESVIDPSLSPMDQAIAVKRAQGLPTAELEKMIPFQKQMQAWDKLQSLGAGEQDLKSRMLKGGARFAADISMRAAGLPRIARAPINMAFRVATTNPAKMIQTIQAVQAASQRGAKTLSKATSYVVDQLVSGKIEKAAKVFESLKDRSTDSPKVRLDAFQKMRIAIGSYASNPNALAEAQAHATSGLESTPQLKQALMTKTNQALTYLQSQLPADRTSSYSVFPGKEQSPPSDAEVTRFLRQADVVNNPLHALKRVADGTVTPEEVDALKSVHPEVFSKLQQAVIGGIMDHGEEPAYRTKLTLASVFGVPTDYSLSPGFAQRMQQNLLPADQGGRPQGSQDSAPRKSNLDLKPFESMQTPGDNLAFKGQS